MKRKKEKNGVTAVCQLRNGDLHPFGAMRGFVPLGGGEERVYRECGKPFLCWMRPW